MTMPSRLFTMAVVNAFAVTLAFACGSGGSTQPVATSVPPTAVRGDAAPTSTANAQPATAVVEVKTYPLPKGSGAHDVAPAADGGVWYTAQAVGKLGWLNPETGEVKEVDLGRGSAPHGVIVGPDGAPWVTAGGLNAIVRVDPASLEVRRFPLPAGSPNANLNTAAFDNLGRLWFTGQNGIYGRLTPSTGELTVFDAPRGSGPYGITKTPSGDVYYASLAGNHVAKIDVETGKATILEPPTKNQGARRVWSDSQGRVWVSEWNAGQLSVFDPRREHLEGVAPAGKDEHAYAVYVDELDKVWVTDFGANAVLRFDPVTSQFQSFPLPDKDGTVRQLLGRRGEVWGTEQAVDKLIVFRY